VKPGVAVEVVVEGVLASIGATCSSVAGGGLGGTVVEERVSGGVARVGPGAADARADVVVSDALM